MTIVVLLGIHVPCFIGYLISVRPRSLLAKMLKCYLCFLRKVDAKNWPLECENFFAWTQFFIRVHCEKLSQLKCIVPWDERQWNCLPLSLKHRQGERDTWEFPSLSTHYHHLWFLPSVWKDNKASFLFFLSETVWHAPLSPLFPGCIGEER